LTFNNPNFTVHSTLVELSWSESSSRQTTNRYGLRIPLA